MCRIGIAAVTVIVGTNVMLVRRLSLDFTFTLASIQYVWASCFLYRYTIGDIYQNMLLEILHSFTDR